MKMNLQSLKSKLGRMLEDEKGASEAAESLIVIVGSSLVAAAVIAVITYLIVGEVSDNNEGSEGSLIAQITDRIKGIIDGILAHEGGEYYND